jgi:rhodanese-related sulfurtransferase
MTEHHTRSDVADMVDIDSSQLADWLASGEPVRVYDVRSQAELAHGLIPGAHWLPLHLIPIELNRLAAEAQKMKLVFYCQAGARSAQACFYLGRSGVAPVYNLRRGYGGWLMSGGQRVESPTDAR